MVVLSMVMRYRRRSSRSIEGYSYLGDGFRKQLFPYVVDGFAGGKVLISFRRHNLHVVFHALFLYLETKSNMIQMKKGFRKQYCMAATESQLQRGEDYAIRSLYMF